MWNQAFKWSSQYHTQDPEKRPEIRKLTQEDFDFIEKAFESIAVNETKEFIKCLNELQIKEQEDINTENKNSKEAESKEEEKLEIIEKMLSYIDGLEVPRNIVRCKKFKDVVYLFFAANSVKIKCQLARLLSLMMQNDKDVQLNALENNIFNCLDYLKETEVYKIEENKEIVNKIIFLLCGLIYGECSQTKKSFVFDNDGFNLLKNLYCKVKSIRILRIIEELTKPEDLNEEMIKQNNDLVKKFIDDKIHLFLIDLLSEEFKTNANNDDDDIKKSILNILSNTCFQWSEEDYNKYIDFYKSYLTMSLVNKIITNKEISEFVTSSNNNIKNNYKNKKTKIDSTGGIVDSKDIKIEEKSDGTKILSLGS